MKWIFILMLFVPSIASAETINYFGIKDGVGLQAYEAPGGRVEYSYKKGDPSIQSGAEYDGFKLSVNITNNSKLPIAPNFYTDSCIGITEDGAKYAFTNADVSVYPNEILNPGAGDNLTFFMKNGNPGEFKEIRCGIGASRDNIVLVQVKRSAS